MNIRGIEIYVKKDYVNNSKGVVIIVHGLAEHCGRYDNLTNALNKASFDVVRYDHRGHGRSGGKKGKLKSFHDYVDDLHVLVTEEKARGKKVFILGHSMGGSVVNIYAAKYHDVDGVISSGAAVQTPKEAAFLNITGYWWLKWMPKKSSFGASLCRDENVVQGYDVDPLNLKKFYVSLVGAMFVSGVRYLKKNYNNITVPILYLHGGADEVCLPEGSKNLFGKIPSKDKKIIIYDEDRHEIYNELNKEEVIGDTINWLNLHC